ncbi:MAG: membrane protein insertase YidC, partial [Spirochaetales bacterium]
MGTIFYTLFIWPVRVGIEAAFVLFQVLFNYRTGLSILLLSFLVNTLLLPIYSAIDRWQKKDADLRQRMKKKVEDIKAVFKGEERRFILNTYYRQMGYSPLSSLKASLGVLLQIPFFIAAYQFLSHTTSLRGQSFLLLKDLSQPDALLSLGFFSVHVMPFIMTAFNVASAFLYSKDMEKKERIQLLGMAVIFLVLLYNSPSGLVLYWTINNLFSFGKNFAFRYVKEPGKLVRRGSIGVSLLILLSVVTEVVALKSKYKAAVIVFSLGIILAPYGWRIILGKVNTLVPDIHRNRSLYFVSCFVVWLLLALLNPIQVIASSPSEFEHPWKLLTLTLLQGFSLCILIPSLLWFLAEQKVRKVLLLSSVSIALLSVTFYFFFSGNYGTLTRGFMFDNPHRLKGEFPLWLQGGVLAGVGVGVYILLKLKKAALLGFVLKGILISVFIMGTQSSLLIAKESNPKEIGGSSHPTKLFTFSQTQENTFVLFLDQAVGVAFYHALDLLPETLREFEGFVWYPKTLSFGDCTILGVPSMLGGYEYTPAQINKRGDAPLVNKINEALTLMPRLMGEAGRRVVITDPSLANLQWIPDTSIFDGMKNVTARNIKGLFSKRFVREKGYVEE